MTTNTLSHASQLSNLELLAQIKALAGQERDATAALVAHLAVLDERRLYLGEGFDSMFSYCVHALHFTENAALSRIGAARAVRRFPHILDLLADGSLNLTTLGLLIPELVPENHLNLLEQARYKKVSEVKELVADLRPLPPVTASIRKLPMPHAESAPLMAGPTAGPIPRDAAEETTLLHLDGGTQEVEAAHQSPPAHADAPARASRPPAVTPLGRELFKVQFSVDAATKEKLRLLRDLLRHQIPNGDIGKIMELAIAALLKSVTKRKLNLTDTPRETLHLSGDRGVSRSRHIPAKIKRAVWSRDAGQCAFVAPSGQRCAARGFLEFHHVVPHAAGGKATIENIQLRCRSHNGYEAELAFGESAAEWRPPASRH